jgi:hypothetical protein
MQAAFYGEYSGKKQLIHNFYPRNDSISSSDEGNAFSLRHEENAKKIRCRDKKIVCNMKNKRP